MRRLTAISTQPVFFTKSATGPDDKPVYEITLEPEDGLYPLPYMARQANGQPWETDGTEKNAAGRTDARAVFSRRLALIRRDRPLGDFRRRGGLFAYRKAAFRFLSRSAVGRLHDRGEARASAPISATATFAPEIRGSDFFPYRPGYLRKEPPMAALARLTNVVQRALARRQIFRRDLARRQSVCRRDHVLAQSADRHHGADCWQLLAASARRHRQRRRPQYRRLRRLHHIEDLGR